MPQASLAFDTWRDGRIGHARASTNWETSVPGRAPTTRNTATTLPRRGQHGAERQRHPECRTPTRSDRSTKPVPSPGAWMAVRSEQRTHGAIDHLSPPAFRRRQQWQFPEWTRVRGDRLRTGSLRTGCAADRRQQRRSRPSGVWHLRVGARHCASRTHARGPFATYRDAAFPIRTEHDPAPSPWPGVARHANRRLNVTTSPERLARTPHPPAHS